MNNPDLVIRLDEKGSIVEILSTLPLTYVTIEKSPIPGKKYIFNDNRKEDFLGTYPEILKHLGMAEPSKAFEPILMFNLCLKTPILKKALERGGYILSGRSIPLVVGHKPLPPDWEKELNTLFNAFVKADKKLMEEYLNLQR